jgi:hypothetical protein
MCFLCPNPLFFAFCAFAVKKRRIFTTEIAEYTEDTQRDTRACVEKHKRYSGSPPNGHHTKWRIKGVGRKSTKSLCSPCPLCSLWFNFLQPYGVFAKFMGLKK